MRHDPTFWILARSAGIAAYVLLTMSVLAGLVVKARPFGRAIKAATAVGLHRTLAFLGLGFVALHGAALVLDSTVHISPLALVVPGASSYRPVAVGAGVFAAWLMALVYASFRTRKWIGIKAWRALHWLTYAVFAAATAHGLAAGTDAARPWGLPLYLGAVGAVTAATAWRGLTVNPRPKGATT
jgi:methionine sulfoxide reductase heme-binding subunit